ncbi:hypothetical protein HMPREF9372_1891 [Sporosarcina newyorkensis 2681]|uniref:YetF-like N-terminal transmembrane domain-containing protein n=2 Tax=Sporosarcina newyorkensis TaxID=759851 RepID=F9DSW0_9BACL|nr:hypothetical protein HMPREF9372_1891 [Sporosarcina newyorkensis 2681]
MAVLQKIIRLALKNIMRINGVQKTMLTKNGLNAAKLAGGILLLIVILRLIGKEDLAQINSYDVMYLPVFGGILEES